MTERSKLVQVLCQILHFRTEEIKIINQKWAVKNTGLVGWLLPHKVSSDIHNINKVHTFIEILLLDICISYIIIFIM